MVRAYAHFLAFLTTLENRLDKRDERGATAVEYGLLVGLIAVVIIVAVTALGSQLSTLFQSITTKLPKG